MKKTPVLALKMTLREAIAGSNTPFKRTVKILIRLKMYLTKLSITKTLELEKTFVNRQPDNVDQDVLNDDSQQAGGIERQFPSSSRPSS